MTVYLMCGLPSSGKSYWARECVKENNGIIVNRDSLREMFHGVYKYDRELEPMIKDIVFDILFKAMSACSFNSEVADRKIDCVIIDETNLTIKKRKEWIEGIRRFKANTKIICLYCTENEKNLEYRMREPKGQSSEVWEGVITSMKKSFESPTKEEGFNEIVQYSIKGE